MRYQLPALALIAVLTATASGAALADKPYTCPSSHHLQSGMCQPNSAQGPALAPFDTTAGATSGGASGGSTPPAGGSGGSTPPAGGSGGSTPPAGGSGGSTPPAGGSGSSIPPTSPASHFPSPGAGGDEQTRTCPSGQTLFLGACYPAR